MKTKERKLRKYNVELWYVQDNLFGAEKIIYQALVRTINYFDEYGNRAPDNYSWISIGTLTKLEHLNKRTVSKAIHSLAEKRYIFLEPRYKQSYIIKLNHEVFEWNEKHEGRVSNALGGAKEYQGVVQNEASKIQSTKIESLKIPLQEFSNENSASANASLDIVKEPEQSEGDAVFVVDSKEESHPGGAKETPPHEGFLVSFDELIGKE